MTIKLTSGDAKIMAAALDSIATYSPSGETRIQACDGYMIVRRGAGHKEKSVQSEKFIFLEIVAYGQDRE